MVNMMPAHAEITTQAAADMLNISRSSVGVLLNQGIIPFTKVKKHRRIRVEDVMRYKAHRCSEYSRAMEELAALDRELGL